MYTPAAVGGAGLVAIRFRCCRICSKRVLRHQCHQCPHCLSPQVLLEALYFSLVAKRLHPEEDDTLVEHPFVEHVSEKISKVRPPQGFALFQAKEEARKVKLLHRMLKVRHLLMLVVPRAEAECWLRELCPCVGPPSPAVISS